MCSSATCASDRVIDAGYANPVFLAQSLPATLAGAAIVQQPQHILYTIDPVPAYEALVRAYLHSIGRPVPANVHVVVTAGGSTQMIAAFYWAAWRHQNCPHRPLKCRSSIPPPYYALHRLICETVQGCQWIGGYSGSLADPDSEDPTSDEADLQVVVSPNNPTGQVQHVEDSGATPYILLDSIYDAPQFTGTYETVNAWSRALFANPANRFGVVGSLSKAGLAGCRIGWALTPHPVLAHWMTEYVQRCTLGTNTWAMALAVPNVHTLMADRGIFYSSVFQELQRRQAAVRQVIPASRIHSSPFVPFVFLSVPPTVFTSAGILVRDGAAFDVNPDTFCRVQLMVAYDDWPVLLERIQRIFA